MLAGPGRRRGRISTQWNIRMPRRSLRAGQGRQPRAVDTPRAAIRTPSANCGSVRRSTCAMIDTAATTSPEESRTGAATENAPGVSASTEVEMPIERIRLAEHVRRRVREQHEPDPGRVQRQARPHVRDDRHGVTAGEPLEVDRPQAVAHRQVHVLARGLEQVLEVRERRAAQPTGGGLPCPQPPQLDAE